MIAIQVLLSATAPAIDAATPTKSQVLHQQLAQKQAELKQKSSRLNAIQRQLNQIADQQNTIEVRLAELESEIAEAEEKIAKSQADLEAVRGELEERLVGLYKQGSSSSMPYVEAMLDEGDLTTVFQRFDALSQIAEEDKNLFDQVEGYLEEQRKGKQELEDKQAEQTADLEELSSVQEAASQSFAAANSEYQSLKSQVSQLRTEVQKADAAAAAAAAEARRLAQLRMAWQQASGWNNSGGGTIQPPPFVFPVRGAHSFINSWGFARSGGRHHQGTDIMAARGTVLVACVTGTISSVNRANTGLGGISINIRGANGYVYYYAHLDRVADGVQNGMAVKAGDVVGYVGNTGNARGGACHLHFQMHPGGRTPVNPYATLRYFDT